jgi:hypothetical protein
MKHTIAGDDTVSNAMLSAVLPATTRDGFMHVRSEELRGRMQKDEFKLLVGQDLISLSATYLGEPLAAIVMFRDAGTAFTEADETALKAIAPIFATALATVVRDPNLPVDGESSEGGPFADDDEKRPNGRDTGDWWKRGEPPPF